MKEQTNERTFPTENQMKDMHQNAWLDFHADAQEAKQEVNRRYAKMVNTFGSYKNMPDGVKNILKDDYAAHDAKWGDNGEEMQKRFGIREPQQKTALGEDQQQKKQEFLQQLQQQKTTQRQPEFER